MQTARHIQRLPVSTDPQLPALAVAQREPIRAGLLRCDEVIQLDRHVPDDGILEEIAVVDDLDGDDGAGAVRTQELVWGFPDGVVGVLEVLGGVDLFFAVPEENFGERVEVAGHRLACVEIFGLVKCEADDTHRCKTVSTHNFERDSG